MLVLKILFFFLLLALLVRISYIMQLGMRLKAMRQNSPRRNVLEKEHKSHARALFLIMTILVVIVEVYVRIKGGLMVIDTLFWIHVVCAGGFFILLILLNTVFSGIRRKKIHRTIAYPCFALFLGVLCTAIPIIWRL